MPPRQHPSHRASYRAGNDYERIPGTGVNGIPSTFRIKKLTRRRPVSQGGGLQQYTPGNESFDKIDLLERLAGVRTRKIRLDLVGYLRNDAKYKPDDYDGHITYLSRNIPYDILYIYEQIRTTTDTGWRIRDLFNSWTDFEFVVLTEVRFTERGYPQTHPILANRYASDKKAERV